ncbi:hypothetical protein [Malacoplasma muris]|uniref:hypothetical protein n=1 Tax=Malacoplasma muris TaxID=2119 RepID=UPI00398EBE72
MNAKDYFLINEFTKIKFPLFAKLTLIYFNFIFLNIFKAWFKPFSDREYIFKYFRKLMIVSSVVWVLSLFLFIAISNTMLLITLIHQELNLGVLGILLGYTIPLAIVLIFNFIYQPIILMSYQKKIKNHYINYLKNDFNHNIIDTLEYQELFIDNKKILSNIKNNLFNSSKWSLFYSESFDYKKNSKDELKAISCDNSFIGSMALKNIFLFTSPIWYISLIYNFMDNNNKKKLNIIGWIWYLISCILIIIATSIFILFLIAIFNNYFFISLENIKTLIPIVVWFVPIIYVFVVHLLGFVVSTIIKNNFLQNINNQSTNC